MEEVKSNSIKEEWADIAGYEGLYQISNMGRVKSLERHIISIRNGKPCKIKVHERIRKIGSYAKNNYYCSVMLSKQCKVKVFLIHRLVAQAFIPNPKPDEYNEVDHINHDVTDNMVTNLRWIDRTGNIRNQRRCLAKRERDLQTAPKSIQDEINQAMELFDL